MIDKDGKVMSARLLEDRRANLQALSLMLYRANNGSSFGVYGKAKEDSVIQYLKDKRDVLNMIINVRAGCAFE